MTNEEIQSIFFLECEEALAAAEDGLMACRDGVADAETVNGIFRSVHSIKGGAGAFSFSDLQAFTHKFETVLSYVRDGDVALSDALTQLMLRAFDLLTDHVAAARGLAAVPDDRQVAAELESAAEAFAAGQSLTADAADEPVCVTNDSAVDDGLGLDFDLDSLIGDLTVEEDSSDTVTLPSDEAVETPFAGWRVCVKPGDAALANGNEPLLLLRQLEELGGQVLAVDASALPPLDGLDPEKGWLGWTWFVPPHVERQAIADIFDFIGDACAVTIDSIDAAPVKAAPDIALPTIAPKIAAVVPSSPVSAIDTKAPAPSAPAPARPAAVTGQTVRVDLSRLDRLIDTVGELVIAQAMMAQKLAGHGLSAIDEMAMLDHLTREIQESTMAIRAQPIGSVFSRVPRIVRELESDTGKRVVLTMSGESTELDKTVVERLGEPLTHLVRNAVDHGIESPDTRVAAGKSAEGHIHLSAEQRSGRIVISLTDDGAGINRDVVLKKAIEKGIVAPGAQLSSEEIDNLIFAPGFSTAETVSNISGRGVGMDVVRQNVKDLGGRITIDSQPGKGCTFTLALPLTLAIADGMIVQVGDQTVVIPLTHVIESLRPGEAEVQGVGQGLQVLNSRGRFLPILPLADAAGALGARTDIDNAVLIIVETEAHGQAALLADAIVDQRQFVIKSLEANFQPVLGVAGATILGDGTVALILDVDGLVAHGFSQPQLTRAA